MVGSATLTMVASSTTMNCATAMSASTAFGLTPETGRGAERVAALDIWICLTPTLPLWMRRTGLGPVDVELSLGEQPGLVGLDEGVEIPNGRDHQLALAVFRVQVVGQAIALAGRTVALEGNRALTVEVGRHLVPVEVIEQRSQSLALPELLRGLGALAFHVDEEVGVLGEQRLLPLRVATIRAVGVGIKEL